MAAAIADTFYGDLERHVWWYSDTYSFVWSLLQVLGRWADGPDGSRCLELMTTALHDSTLPLSARLTICLSSRSLAQSERLLLETIAAGGTLTIDQAIRWRAPGLRKLAENLRPHVSDAAILDRLIEALAHVEPFGHAVPWQ